MKKSSLDVRGKACPWPILLISEKLKLMLAGDLLEVIADYPPVKENIIRAVKENGHEILNVVEEGSQIRIIIRKRNGK